MVHFLLHQEKSVNLSSDTHIKNYFRLNNIYLYKVILAKLNASVPIKDVDKDLYKKFKEKAVLNGIKVGIALTNVMEKWLNEENQESDDELIRIKNNETFRKMVKSIRGKT